MNDTQNKIISKEKEYFKYDGNADIYKSDYQKKEREEVLKKKIIEVFHNNSQEYDKILEYLNNYNVGVL